MEIFRGIDGRFSIDPWNQRHISVKSTETFHGINGIVHRIYGIVPWNPLNFHGINGKNLWHFMNFHNFLLLVYLPSTAMETLKMPSEYSVDFNRGFQGFSMANLEKGVTLSTKCQADL